MAQGICEVIKVSKNKISGGGKGHSHFGGEPRKSVNDLFSMGIEHSDHVAVVEIHGWANIPTISSMQ
jgi:hypothetical protein